MSWNDLILMRAAQNGLSTQTSVLKSIQNLARPLAPWDGTDKPKAIFYILAVWLSSHETCMIYVTTTLDPLAYQSHNGNSVGGTNKYVILSIFSIPCIATTQYMMLLEDIYAFSDFNLHVSDYLG